MNRTRAATIVGPIAVFTMLAITWSTAWAVPPDTGPISGKAVATQDPPGSCPGRPNTIPFDATVQIQGGNLQIDDPGGTTKGPIAADGTARLTGAGQQYTLRSSTPTRLMFQEVNGGCTFSTVIDLAGPLPSLVESTPATDTPVTDAPATDAPVSGSTGAQDGTNLDWLWLSLAGLGVMVTGAGIVALRRKPTVDDEHLDIIDAFALAFPGESGLPTLDGLRGDFDAKQQQLIDAVETKLSELSRFSVAYGQAWNGAAAATKSYMRDYRPLVRDLKGIWDAFPDRDWANARAKYVEDIVNYTMIAFDAGKGMITSLGAAEAAYQATYMEGTLLKAVSAFRQAGRPVAVSQSLLQSVQAAKALHAAQWAQKIRFAEQALAKGAPAVAKTAFATPAQNLAWIKSWVGKFKVNPFRGTANCQLTTGVVSDVLKTGRTDVFAPNLYTGGGDMLVMEQAMANGTLLTNPQLEQAIGREITNTTFGGLEHALAAEAHGTQYWIIVSEGKYAHIFNGVNLNGTTFFIDGQAAMVSTSLNETLAASGYAKPVIGYLKLP